MRARLWPIAFALAGSMTACALAFDTDVLVSDRDGAGAGGGDGSAPGTDARSDDGAGIGPVIDAGPDAPIELIEDAATEPPLFVDEFDRPDSPDLGNGWTEKNPATFALENGAAVKLTVGTFYRDNLAYRPDISERDVEVIAEFDVTQWPCGSPQVHARIQPSTVGTLNSLDSYLVFIEDERADAATLARQHGSAYSVKLAELPFPAQTPGHFRLVLRVKNSETVAVAAAFDKEVGGIWERVQIGAANDLKSNPDGIRTAGHVGFSGDKSSSGRFRYTRFQVSRIK